MDEDDRIILASAILGVDVTEIYSPERIAKVATEFGLVQGFLDAVDLKAWAMDRDRARHQITH